MCGKCDCCGCYVQLTPTGGAKLDVECWKSKVVEALSKLTPQDIYELRLLSLSG